MNLQILRQSNLVNRIIIVHLAQAQKNRFSCITLNKLTTIRLEREREGADGEGESKTF